MRLWKERALPLHLPARAARHPGCDDRGCRLLSMLTLDQDTSRIPLVTHITAPSFGAGQTAAGAADVFRGFVPGSFD
jgi:hypothetical protein